MEKLLETTKDPGNVLFKMLDDMREIRQLSELQIQKTIQASLDIENTPKEPPVVIKIFSLIKLYLTFFFRVGRRCSLTAATLPCRKDGNKLKGRELQIERHLQGVRRTIMDLKYERRNPGRIIKHLTNADVDPSLLAQPQFTALDLSPEHIAKEASRKNHVERKNTYNLNVDSGLEDFKINSPHTSPLEENNYALSYNKGQLKKLRDGLTHVSRHMAQYKSPKRSNRSQMSDAHPLASEADSVREVNDNHSNETTMTEEASESGDFSLKRKPKTKSSLFRRNAAVRANFNKQVITEFERNLNPREEFLKVLGMTEKARSPSKKLGFFLLENKVKKSFSSDKINLTGSEFLGSPKWMNTQGNDDNHNAIESFFVTEQQKIGVRKSSDARSSLSRILVGGSHKDLKVVTGNILDKRTGLESRSTVSRKDYTREVSAIDEINDGLKRYKQLSVDCENNIKSTTAIQTTMERGFGKLNGVLGKISDGITTPNAEVDNRIKDEIFMYMNNPLFVVPGYRRKPKAKQGKNNRGE